MMIVKISKAVEVQVSGPLPNDSFRSVVINVCSKWSGIDVVKGSLYINSLYCRYIRPLVRDKVVGDGNC